jgi:HlyD family secretion protein
MRNRSTQALLRSSLVSAEEAERVGVDLHQAQAAVQMRQAALKRAQVDFSRTTIYAPISGVVISRNVDVGQTVAASFNTPTLFLIANDLSKMQIDAMVSEADVGGVEESQKVTFTVDAFPTRQFEGLVKQVRFAPTTNQNVVNYATIVEVNNADLKLRPGMTANATIITAQRTNVLKIPNAALRFRPPEQLAAKESGRGGEPGGKADATNRLAMARGGDPSAAGPASPQPDAGEGRPGREEMRRRFESLPPEQQAAIRERMRARFGEGGPPGGPGGMPPLGGFPGMGGRGGGPRASSGEPVTRTVYVLGKEPSPTGGERAAPKPVRVKVGITDNASTEVLEGLKEGDVVLTGLNTPQLASQTNVLRSPFGGPFGMRPPR